MSANLQSIDARIAPAARPLRIRAQREIASLFESALSFGDGYTAAHCVHELWMRGEMAVHIDLALEKIWQRAAASIPDWLPMRHVEWLDTVYDVAARFRASRGRSNIYLVLLDYSDSRDEPYGVYVGMSHYAPALRFDQHKAGIRAAGCVTRRGLEVLLGPVLHLQHIERAQAERIEEQLAEALTAAGLFVQGGH
ncbi:MAG TPA: hypothetical protein VHZ99_14255 [Steroidobacteraceae bacterium]|jgi:hypothetical protein|nr:hypothetical protein [Steroidobacteraceae bacterium]